MKTQDGFVALIAVLILGAVGTAITISMLLIGISTSQTALILQKDTQLRAVANSCAEAALQKINDSTPYSGTDSLSLGDGNCEHTVTNNGGQSRSIEVQATIDEHTKYISIDIDAINPNINVTSWQEVTNN